MAPSSRGQMPARRFASDASRSINSVHSADGNKEPLAQRLLNPPSSSNVPLPPIITTSSTRSSTSQTPEDLKHMEKLNGELYELIALALRAYVSSWWHGKFAPRDREFLPEITLVVASVIRVLSSRVQDADLHYLILSDVPTLLAQHIRDYRLASTKLHTSYAPSAEDLAQVFHRIQSHRALSSSGSIAGSGGEGLNSVVENGIIDDTYLRQAVDHVLKACLPPEDWASEMERSIVREVVVRSVLGSVLPRLAQPWFLHTIVLALLGAPRPVEPPASPPPRPAHTFQTLVVAFLTFIQTISTFGLNTIAFLQNTFALVATINALPLQGNGYTNVDTGREANLEPGNYAEAMLDFGAEFLSLRERGASNALLAMFSTSSGFASSFVDKLLTHMLETTLLTTQRTTSFIILAKNLLFPNGYPGPPPHIPSYGEQREIRKALESRLRELVPNPIAPYLLGPSSEARDTTVRDALEPFSNEECNAHLVMLLFDAVLLTLFPEMGVEEHTVSPSVVDEDDRLDVDNVLSPRSSEAST